MESILKIITSICSILSFFGIIGLGIFHKLVSDKIIGNELFHLSKDVNDIKEEQKCIKKEVIEQGKLIAQIDTRCNERVNCQ